MIVYLILMAVVLILAYPLIERRPSFVKKLCYVICVFTAMYMVSVLRYGLGNDYFSYIYIFRQIADTSGLDLLNCGYEPGFVLLTKIISVFTMNTDIMYGVYALVILGLTAYAIFRHSENIWMSTMMFISLTFFYCSLSFIRQSLALAVILLAYRFIKERNHFIVMLFIFLACLFHSTAIILIPIYLLAVLIKPTKIVVAVYAFIFSLVYALSWPILNIAVVILPQYKNYLNLSFIQKGFSFTYLIVPTIIMLLALFAHFTGYGKAYPKQSALFTNFAIFNFFIWFISTKHFVIERFSMYVYIMMIMFIPSIVNYYRKRLQMHLHHKRAVAALESGRKIRRLRFDKTVDELFRESKISKKNGEVSEEKTAVNEKDEERNRILSEIMGEEIGANGNAFAETDSADSKTVKKKADRYTADEKYLPENYQYKKTSNKFIDFVKHPGFAYGTFMTVTLLSCLWYNYFGLTTGTNGFHGVVPYISNFPGYMEAYFEIEEDAVHANKNLKKDEDLVSYLYRIKSNENYVVFISGKGDFVSGMNNGAYTAIKNVGLEKLLTASRDDNYIAIIDGGEEIYEECAEYDLEYSDNISGYNVNMTSTWKNSQIKIGSKDFSPNDVGLNFVVLDKTKKVIVDKVRFKGYYVMLAATR